MAGKSSALCLIGPEKADSASICSPSAIATEPILLDVSTANVKGFCAIGFQYSMFYYLQGPCYGHKKRFLDDYFSPSFPRLSSLPGKRLNIIGQAVINQIFLLQKDAIMLNWTIISAA